MHDPSSPRRRTKAAIGMTLAAGLAVTGISVAFAENDDPNDNAVASTLAEARAEQAPRAQRDAWLDQVGEYVELETARQYAVAVYANAANWHAVRQYADALAAQATSSGSGSHLDAIRACESGGDYSAVSSSGTYRGAYQFDQATWEAVGGSGDPAAASPAEQDLRAQMLYEQSGSSPWPVCGS